MNLDVRGRMKNAFGYHASHEQFPPSALLRYVQAAESAGFTCAMSSDHFMPWSEAQGQSGFSWAWLGAAMHATALPFGLVCTPGYRYHPAIVAQAAATLAEMFGGERFWVALGSGEAMNEQITGVAWPVKSERNAILYECVEIIRALWRGETVTHYGRIRVEEAKLYTRPAVAPRIVGPAVSPATARFVASWAEGLITVNQPLEIVKNIVRQFHAGGGAGKPLAVQVHVSYAKSTDAARKNAHEQWRNLVFESSLLGNVRHVRDLEAAGAFVTPDAMDAHVCISSDPAQHVAWLRDLLELGFTQIQIHNVGRNQEEFIDVFGAKVLPQLT
jgi:coenzyme F420-dependent glucose-6-phosphate dehydrogenase